MFKKHAVLTVMPMGTGKTECFIELCKRAIEKKPDVRILILLNKVMLVDQTVRRLAGHLSERTIGVYCGTLNRKELHPITVASIQSVYDQDLSGINIVILDEAHRMTVDEDSQYQVLLRSLITSNKKLKILGFTATPYRSNGYIYGKEELFKEIDFKYDIKDAIRDGYLVPPKLKATTQGYDTTGVALRLGDFDIGELSKLVESEDKISAQVAEAMLRLSGRNKIAWACTTIEHAQKLHALIPEPASIIHSKMGRPDQEKNRHEFEFGTVRHIVFVTMLSEGVDIPCIDAIALCRPTRSPTLALQTIGRALRLFPGKKDALILDFGEVIQSIGPLDDPRIPEKGSRKGQSAPAVMKFCKGCLEYVPVATLVCPECHMEFPKPERSTGTQRPDEASALFKKTKQPLVSRVTAITLTRYISGNQNLCLRIMYDTDNMVQRTISEFYVWNNDYARYKAMRRCGEIGVVWKQELDDLIRQPVRNPPTMIEYILEKYPKVTKLLFNGIADGKGNRETNPALAQFAK